MKQFLAPYTDFIRYFYLGNMCVTHIHAYNKQCTSTKWMSICKLQAKAYLIKHNYYKILNAIHHTFMTKVYAGKQMRFTNHHSTKTLKLEVYQLYFLNTGFSKIIILKKYNNNNIIGIAIIILSSYNSPLQIYVV